MGEAIGQLLPFAIGVTISPMPIVAMVLMLITPKARSNGFAFIAGWIVGVALAGAVALAILGPTSTSDDGTTASWTYWLKLVLGVALLGLAVKEWKARPAPDADVPMPKWMGMLDGFTAVKAAGLAGYACDLGLCSPEWTRTTNPAINSRMLCQLSYGGPVARRRRGTTIPDRGYAC